MKQQIRDTITVTKTRGLKQSIIDLVCSGRAWKLYDRNLEITIDRNDINIRFAGLNRVRVGTCGLSEYDAVGKILKTVNGLRSRYHEIKFVLDEYRRKSDHAAHMSDDELHDYINTSSDVEIIDNKIYISSEHSRLGYQETVEIPKDARSKFKNTEQHREEENENRT